MNKFNFKWIAVFLITYFICHLPARVWWVKVLLLGLICLTLLFLLTAFFGVIFGMKLLNGLIKSDGYFTIRYKKIPVSYLWNLNGGGIIFAYEFVHIVSKKIGKVNHVYEYGAGPGFIGFSLLANGLCDRLTLSDVNPEAVKAIEHTIKRNGLQDKVTVCLSDCLDSIPAHEKWDLVVGNPPWDMNSKNKKNIRVADVGGHVHEKFYQDIKKFLAPEGRILLIEGGEFTKPASFKKMIENNDLVFVESFKPARLLTISKDLNEYQGTNIFLVIFLRLSMYIRECYFILIK